MKLSIIIPVYNEEKTVGKLISKVRSAKPGKGITKETIVINDGSSDGSSQILSEIRGIHLYTHKTNKGKGAAIRTGFSKATGDLILIQDADLEYNPNDYSRLIKPIIKRKADVVYGTRLAKEPLRFWGKNKTPLPLHYIGNTFLTAFTNVLYGSRLTDMETCYKVFKSDIIKMLSLNSNKFDIEPEITAKILRKGIKIHEVPIKTKPRDYSEGKKITWRDGLVAIWTLVKYRIID